MAEFDNLKNKQGNSVDNSSSDTYYFTAICEQIEQVIGNNTELSDIQKERCKQRFREIFECSHEEFKIHQKPSQNAEKEVNKDNVDKVKKNYLNSEIWPKFENTIKDVVKIRQTYPLECRKLLTAKANQENLVVSATTVEPGPSRICQDSVINIESDLYVKLQEMKERLEHLSQKSSPIVEKATRLKTAINIENSNKVYRKNNDECSTPQKKRLKTHSSPVNLNNYDSLRRSPRLKTRFNSQQLHTS